MHENVCCSRFIGRGKIFKIKFSQSPCLLSEAENIQRTYSEIRWEECLWWAKVRKKGSEYYIVISVSQYAVWGYLTTTRKIRDCIGGVSARTIRKIVVKTWWWFCASKCSLKQLDRAWSVDVEVTFVLQSKRGWILPSFREEEISLSCSKNKKDKQNQWGKI